MRVSKGRVEQDGYCIVEGVFSNAECLEFLKALSASSSARSRAGIRHLLSSPAIALLANDERLLRIASAAMGQEPVPFRATLFDKSGDANWSVVWHQDTALPLRTKFDAPGWGPWSSKSGVLYAHAPTAALKRVIALRVHLDDSGLVNGPLRVLPGTQMHGVLSDDRVEQVARTTAPVDCVVRRGGVLAMRPLLIHSSPRIEAALPRRVLHIEYSETLTLGPGIELATA